MSWPIAVVTRLDTTEEAEWRDQIAALLPGERTLSFRDMSSEERQAVAIATWRTPTLPRSRRCPGLVWLPSLWAGVEG